MLAGVCVVLCLVTLGLYWQTLGHEFLNYDDDFYLTNNLRVQAGFALENIEWAFRSTLAAHWHPLTWLSHMLDFKLFGMNPGGHHIASVFFHCANSVLLFLLLSRMTRGAWRAAFVAALFAVHPLHVESVAWASERKDALSAFFWFLTMVAYLWYVSKPGAIRYLAVAFVLHALLCPKA